MVVDYSTQSAASDPGKHRWRFDPLPSDLASDVSPMTKDGFELAKHIHHPMCDITTSDLCVRLAEAGDRHDLRASIRATRPKLMGVVSGTTLLETRITAPVDDRRVSFALADVADGNGNAQVGWDYGWGAFGARG